MVEVFFRSPVGNIQGRYSPSPKANAPVALVFHPDPTKGGSMNNTVTYAIFRCFAVAGVSVLRINLPGAGESQGCAKDQDQHFAAAIAALDWLQSQNPEASHCWVAGFSSGAYLAAQIALRRPEVENFILVSPDINEYDFSLAIPSSSPGLVVQGEKDTYVNAHKVKSIVSQWKQKNDSMVVFESIKEADHLYNKNIEALSNICLEYIDINLAVRVVKPVRKKRRRRRKKDKDYGSSD